MVYKQAWSIKNYRYVGDISIGAIVVELLPRTTALAKRTSISLVSAEAARLRAL
jgi:hypothetical protein